MIIYYLNSKNALKLKYGGLTNGRKRRDGRNDRKCRYECRNGKRIVKWRRKRRMFSKLTNSIAIADASNYTKGRGNYRIFKLTPHHMAGKLTGLQCARIFQQSGRNASANYTIGYDGDIVGCVPEEDRAWTSGNRNNDFQAITIECSNDEIGGNWHISDKTWNSLVELCVDICTRYNFRLNYTGDANGSLTRHNMFQSTTCPGPYLQSKFTELAEIVNKRLDGGIVPHKEYTYTQFVTELQSTIRAKVDGIAGPETLSKTPTLSRFKNRTHRAVLPVQKYLYALGYTEVGNADGIAGAKFETAVKHYQRDNGCVQDGELTARAKTWKKLLKLL